MLIFLAPKLASEITQTAIKNNSESMVGHLASGDRSRSGSVRNKKSDTFFGFSPLGIRLLLPLAVYWGHMFHTPLKTTSASQKSTQLSKIRGPAPQVIF